MTTSAKTVITVLSVILATLVALAIAGFAFFAGSDGEGSGSDRKVGSAPVTIVALEGGAT